MCVAAIAWEAHPHWRLVAIGNRDEYHARPAAPLEQWDNGLIAGRDLQSGGTWLGVSPQRFALVTNLRGFDLPDPDKTSRGALVTDLLAGTGPYGDPATAQLEQFNPFNLFLADARGAHFLSNRPGPIRAALGQGIYGLSNGPLDEPWPKTLQLKAALLDWLTAQRTDFAPLFAALTNETLAPIGLTSADPSEIASEAPQTAPFIRNPVYGTRCCTVVAIDRAGHGTIIERRFDACASLSGESSARFAWGTPGL